MSVELILVLLFLGVFVGFMAGLLGIGGGVIMVPVFTAIFLHQGLASDQVVHIALGTSMAGIVVTSLSSMLAHKKRGSILWPVFRSMMPGILLGTFLATFLVNYINGVVLASMFAIFIFFVALQMLFSPSIKKSGHDANQVELFTAGCGIGAISAMVSIGGGSMTVPYLTWRNIDPLKAIGTSAAIGVPISISGSIGYLINGWSNTDLDHYILGYIYLPAVLLISLMSVLIAPIGVRCAHLLPVSILKKIFACLLLSLSINMVVSIVEYF